MEKYRKYKGKKGRGETKNAEMRGINNNMRCFEILEIPSTVNTLSSINNNMRCFEIPAEFDLDEWLSDKQ